MGMLVVSTAQCQCSGAVPPGIANIMIPVSQCLGNNLPMATIMDKEVVNIPTFGMCNLTTNPSVAVATASASGVHTPAPCLPFILAPWAPCAPTVMIGGKPALTHDSKAVCNWGGTISIVNPAATTVQTG